jgi:hypothetical protein
MNKPTKSINARWFEYILDMVEKVSMERGNERLRYNFGLRTER